MTATEGITNIDVTIQVTEKVRCGATRTQLAIANGLRIRFGGEKVKPEWFYELIENKTRTIELAWTFYNVKVYSPPGGHIHVVPSSEPVQLIKNDRPVM